MKKAKRPRSIFFRIVIACLAILLAGFCVLEAIIIPVPARIRAATSSSSWAPRSTTAARPRC